MKIESPKRFLLIASLGCGTWCCGTSTDGTGTADVTNPPGSGGSSFNRDVGTALGSSGSIVLSAAGGAIGNTGTPASGGANASDGVRENSDSTSEAGGARTGTGGRGGNVTDAGVGGSGGRSANAQTGGRGGSSLTAKTGGRGGSSGAVSGSGNPGTGGATGSRGSTSATTARTSGDAGATAVSGAVVPSSGCGKAAPPASTKRQTIDVDGTPREYIVVYPTSYDSNRPYRVLYEFHGYQGSAEENVRFQWYGIQPLSGDSVIFVAPQGLGSPAGWPNSNGQDVAFVRKLVSNINETFCTDTSRVFATGFSYGAMLTNTLGCQMGDVFRAIAPVSGGGPTGKCVGKPAAVVIHGAADTTVDVSSGMSSRDHWLNANHCETTTIPMEPSPCVLYQGCDAGYPVAWCEHTGGHQILPKVLGPAIWNFISQF